VKVAELLFEGPYSHESDYTPSIKMDSYPSFDGMNREFKFLGTLEKEDREFNFWLSNNNLFAKVTTPGVNEIGQDRELVVTNITFHKHPTGLPVDNELQAHTVYTHRDYRGNNLALALYVVLCRYGYTIVSDFEHYNGGKALWKKMALEADARRFAVRVWSDENDDWVRGDDGKPLLYNGANLGDDDVWNDLDRHALPATLLVLSHE
jgi:hypothetical protein